MNDTPQTFATQTQTASEVPRTAGDVARELGKSVTTIKQLALQVKAPVQRTPGGVWIFQPLAVEKLKQEIARRELERDRK
jgi:hypothetical protein